MSEIKETPMDPEDLIPQDEERKPGWFLLLSYVVIVAFCIYYLVTYWDWKSDYDVQQEKIKTEMSAGAP